MSRLPPLPAALAARLAPSPAAPPRCDECGARATRTTTNGAVVFHWCARHAPRPAAASTRPVRARKAARTPVVPSAASAATGVARGGSAPLTVTVALRLASEPNERGAWQRTARRSSRQRVAVRAALTHVLAGRAVAFPAVVVIVRIAPRALDSDNAWASAKHARDGAADALGIDDSDPRVRWDVRQERGRQFAARIEVHEGARDCGHCGGKGWRAKGDR